MKILTVDDDPIFLDLIEMELRALGEHEILQATSANGALRLVRNAAHRFDCIILDIMMPGVDGIELCARLRNEPFVKGVPILMVTAQTAIEEVDRAFAAGATDYLNKPLNSRELRGRLQMAERLSHELQTIRNPGNGESVDIAESLPVEGISSAVHYVAMQNYLLKLGRMKLLSRQAVCVQISNIDEIHSGASIAEFKRTIQDVAKSISESFGNRSKMISYAGSGNFLILLDRIAGFKDEAVGDLLSEKMTKLAGKYKNYGKVSPRLRLGPMVAPSLIFLQPADELLLMAIDGAHKNGIDVNWRSYEMRFQSSQVS